MLYLGIFFSYYVISQFKNITGLSDEKLTYFGAIKAIFNGCSRVIWAALMDKFGFKKTYIVIMVLQLISASLIWSQRTHLTTYSICVLIAYTTNGATFSMFPSACVKVFGTTNGGLIFTVMMFFVPCSSFTNVIFSNFGFSPK